VVSVNGATYWVVEGSERIVSFDHRSEQVKTVTPLPVSDGPISHLTEVQRRLSVAIATKVDPNSVCYYGRGYGTIEVLFKYISLDTVNTFACSKLTNLMICKFDLTIV
jgi:hypothetical protein